MKFDEMFKRATGVPHSISYIPNLMSMGEHVWVLINYFMP